MAEQHYVDDKSNSWLLIDNNSNVVTRQQIPPPNPMIFMPHNTMPLNSSYNNYQGYNVQPYSNNPFLVQQPLGLNENGAKPFYQAQFNSSPSNMMGQNSFSNNILIYPNNDPAPISNSSLNSLNATESSGTSFSLPASNSNNNNNSNSSLGNNNNSNSSLGHLFSSTTDATSTNQLSNSMAVEEKIELKPHKVTHVANTNEYFECPVCQGFFSKDLVDAHVRVCLAGVDSKASYDYRADAEELRIKSEARLKEEEENERLLREMLAQEEREESERNMDLISHVDGFQCLVCNKTNSDYSQLFMLDSCGHSSCIVCAHDYAVKYWKEKKKSTIGCFFESCGKSFLQFELKQLFNESEFQQYEEFTVTELIESNNSFLKCPNPGCTEVIERVPYIGERRGKSEEDLHKEENRFRCRQCQTEFCSSCSSIPYHEGFTCVKFKDYQKAKHCRFCEDQLTKINMAPVGQYSNFRALHDVCSKDECMERREICCPSILNCGHYCAGVKGERNCNICFDEKCCTDANQNGDSFCNICWVEGLKSAPAIKLKCGHIFHYQCILKQVSSKWSSANITFGFMDCPLCNTEVEQETLAEVLKPMKELKELIKDRALKRLHYLKEENAKEIVEKGGMFYNNPVGYAFKRYCYYQCYTCHKPYYGGERACNAEQRVAAHNPKELICGACSGVGLKNDGKPCKHGNDYIEWKCKFCCNVAAYFCWGNTHFCEPCHKEAVAVSKRNVNLLPKCSCKVAHPPQGQEFCIGCSMCKLEKLFDQQM